MTRERKLFRGTYKTIMGYVVIDSQQDAGSSNTSGRIFGSETGHTALFSSPVDDYTQEKFSYAKPCKPLNSLGGRECVSFETPSLNPLTPVQKFYRKYPNWSEQARQLGINLK